MKKVVVIFVVCALLMSGCKYIVLPEGLEQTGGTGGELGTWTGLVTNVFSTDAGDLHVDLAIRNDTGDWSTM